MTNREARDYVSFGLRCVANNPKLEFWQVTELERAAKVSDYVAEEIKDIVEKGRKEKKETEEINKAIELYYAKDFEKEFTKFPYDLFKTMSGEFERADGVKVPYSAFIKNLIKFGVIVGADID